VRDGPDWAVVRHHHVLHPNALAGRYRRGRFPEFLAPLGGGIGRQPMLDLGQPGR
jgi:hypothetical protein